MPVMTVETPGAAESSATRTWEASSVSMPRSERIAALRLGTGSDDRSSWRSVIRDQRLRQSIRRAQARELVKRNVALLCDVPRGTAGRPSKSLTLAQAADLLTAAKKHPTMHAYIVVSLLTGARTEELRALTWSHTDLDGEPPSVQLWRSVREGGDTKTRLSRRTLEPRTIA